ncbi:MAG: lytic murein transglycosylase [Candidatus Taylorbacteria bacterium]
MLALSVFSLVLLSYSDQYLPHVYAQSEEAITARQKQLEAELEQVLKEIDEQTVILDSERQKGASLERDVAILNAQIAKAKLNIRARELAIEALGKDITKKDETIEALNARIDKNKESLAELIRKTNEIDSFSLVEAVLAKSDFSDFFADVDSYASIQESLQTTVRVIRDDKSENEVQKDSLNKKRLKEIDAKISIEDEKRKIETAEAEKKRLLGLSKQQQQSYATVLSQRQAKAAAIRSALFSLRDTAAIPFGKALEYANAASKSTGVRPAFILAILTQESNLGKNVGTCNRPGDPPEKGWQSIMKPERDQAPYLRITSALGLDPASMPLSCPMGGGYGGAMGPSQFIPSTWEMYQARIGDVVGKTNPNPWEPRDAIVATSLFVADLGASAGGYSAEREAALRYYAGGNWSLPKNAFYGDQVMAKAQLIQETMIDPLQGL